MSHAHSPLLQRALEVDVGDLITEVCRLVDQGDEAIFHGEGDFCAWFDVLLEDAGRCYVETCAAGRKER